MNFSQKNPFSSSDEKKGELNTLVHHFSSFTSCCKITSDQIACCHRSRLCVMMCVLDLMFDGTLYKLPSLPSWSKKLYFIALKSWLSRTALIKKSRLDLTATRRQRLLVLSSSVWDHESAEKSEIATSYLTDTDTSLSTTSILDGVEGKIRRSREKASPFHFLSASLINLVPVMAKKVETFVFQNQVREDHESKLQEAIVAYYGQLMAQVHHNLLQLEFLRALRSQQPLSEPSFGAAAAVAAGQIRGKNSWILMIIRRSPRLKIDRLISCVKFVDK